MLSFHDVTAIAHLEGQNRRLAKILAFVASHDTAGPPRIDGPFVVWDSYVGNPDGRGGFTWSKERLTAANMTEARNLLGY